MKILCLVYDHPRNPWVGGGGAVRVQEIFSRLAAGGSTVTILSGKYPGAEDYREGALTWKFVGTPRNYLMSTLSYAFHAARFVWKHGGEYDVVVEDFAPWNPVFSRFLTGTPAVLHVNHREGSGIIKRWNLIGVPFYFLEMFYPRLFAHVTALSPWTKKKIKVRHAEVFPAGIREEGQQQGRRSSADEGYVLYVGRLHMRNKGLDTLLEAVKRMKGTRLVIAGKGPDERELFRMAQGLDVDFKGFVSEGEKNALLGRARVFVLPSRFEGWGIVVLEAAAFGKPVLVSDIPELSFAVAGGFGMSFRRGDSGDLASKLNELLENESLRAEMGARAVDYVRDYTWERISEHYAKFLERIAA
jgi:glycosyltransferase involved in cell wall biosynthesis